MTDVSINDYDTFDKICEKRDLYMEFGKHKTLDYLNLSLNLPLNFNVLSIYTTRYSKALHDFLRIKPNFRQVQQNEAKRKAMLRNLNNICYLNNHLYNSDANEVDFKKSGVNFIKAHIGTRSMRGNNQQIMMVNLKTYEDEKEEDFEEYKHNDWKCGHDESHDFEQDGIRKAFTKKYIEEHEEFKGLDGQIKVNKPKFTKLKNAGGSGAYAEKEFYENGQCIWPLNLMSLFHPFRLSDPLDIDLEELFKLAIPFLDIRLGIQGVAESFTFIISKNKPKKPKYRSLLQDQGDKFFNDMNWKISQYQSSTITTSMLSILVSVIEFKEREIAEIINNWLYILLIIMKIPGTKNLSLSYISKLLLKDEFNIKSTARDVILRFFFYNMDIDKEQFLLDEWSALLMDTYKQLKLNNKYIRGSLADPSGIPSLGMNSAKDYTALTKYFGELEIRALIIISYYSLNYVQYVDPKIARRCSKLVIMLTRITVAQSHTNRMYMHLLSILLQLLSTGIRIYHMTYENEEMLEDIIKLLLHTYNDYKPIANSEHSNIKLNDFNFFLIKVTNPELSLKRVAAKTLLEIGENFPTKFLAYIEKEAHSLQESHEFQKDPHDVPLRKNSLVDVTIILGILVKKFPMVDFHHDSQRLAVGTSIGPIAIYDVRTSAKWRVLEGHSGKITCLKFNTSGHYLVSYSATDLSLRLWKVGNTGFFSGIMGVTAK